MIGRWVKRVTGRELEGQKSVFFITLHKSASTLFTNDVLPLVPTLRHQDFSSLAYSGELVKCPEYQDFGCLYGPIRVVVPPSHTNNLVYELTVKDVCEREFLRNRRAVFMVRDPRDILVSSFYSFGFHHGLSDVQQIQRQQLQAREEINDLSIDDYCKAQTASIRTRMLILWDLLEECEDSLLLRYEDFLFSFEKTAARLADFFSLPAETFASLETKLRPREKEVPGSHRRSGKPGEFLSKLDLRTIREVDEGLGLVLEKFCYPVAEEIRREYRDHFSTR